MTLLLTEEQTMLKESAASFALSNGSQAALRARRSTPTVASLDISLWQNIVELGWTAIPFDERYGGLGLGFAELGIVMEEMGRSLLSTPLLSSVVLAGGAIDLCGSEEQKQALLPSISDGSALWAFAYQETARHQPYSISTRLEQEGEGYLLSGAKCLVLDGSIATDLIVLARISGSPGDGEGLSLVRCPANADGVNRKTNLLIDGRYVANITFDHVHIPPEQVLDGADSIAGVIDELFDRAATAISAEMVGGVQAAFEMTLGYLKVREQFGATIGSFQGLKHRAARWFCEVELSKSIVVQALRAIDEQSETRTELASACKARLSNTYRLSGSEGIQMHGGIGVTDEHDIGLYMKHGRVTEMLFGDANFHLDRFATVRGY